MQLHGGDFQRHGVDLRPYGFVSLLMAVAHSRLGGFHAHGETFRLMASGGRLMADTGKFMAECVKLMAERCNPLAKRLFASRSGLQTHPRASRVTTLIGMLSLLPSSQLILALWLLAAVAPAATALLNGSLVPFPVAESRAKISAREAGGSLAVESKAAKDDFSLDWLASDGDGEMQSLRLPDTRPIAPLATGDAVALRDSSVLQTDLQRHRPKAA
jgi:hypothetical protein